MPANEPAKTRTTPAPQPYDFFDTMRRELSRVFDRFEFGRMDWPMPITRQGTSLIAPDLDVHENNTSVTIEAEIPGVDEKDVHVTFADGILTVKGEKKVEHEEKKENFYVSERSFGSFERSIRLPDSVDENKIDARMEKGVLKITAAKKPGATASERRIEIKNA